MVKERYETRLDSKRYTIWVKIQCVGYVIGKWGWENFGNV